MAAFSSKDYVTAEKPKGPRVSQINIRHGHSLNNPHRAPFASGATAARALLVHAEAQLTSPETGPAYFNQLRQLYSGATVTGERVKKRLQQRQQRAAAALSNSDVELTEAQLRLVVDIAQVQAELAARLLPEVTDAGRSNDEVIDEVDSITRQALRSAAQMRDGAVIGRELVDPNAWSRALSERMGVLPGNQENDADMIVRFTRLINELERELPLAIDRDEPLWDIDEAINPHDFALTRDRLSAAQGADFNDQDDAANEDLDVQARAAVWRNMNMDEREFAATKIALTPAQRIEVGMQIVNSTPPLIQLPEVELAQGRYDVIMATAEEANVMESLVQWAGETRNYPGPEAISEQVAGMKTITMPSGQLGPNTIGLSVDNNPALVSHAIQVISKLPADYRLLIHADNDQVAQQLMDARRAALAEQGIERPFLDGSDATRAFGGWTLPGDADRILGHDRHDLQAFVAASDRIAVYADEPATETTGINRANEQLREARSYAATAQAAVATVIQTAKDDGSDKLRAAIAEIEDNGGNFAKIAETAGLSRDDKRLAQDIVRRITASKAATKTAANASRTVDRIANGSRSEDFNRARTGQVARARVIDAAHRQGKLKQVFAPATEAAVSGITTSVGKIVEVRGWEAAMRASSLLDGQDFRSSRLVEALGNGIGDRYNGRRALTATLVGGSNFFSAQKGAGKGLDALAERVDMLPKNGVILIDDNDKNPVVDMVVKRAFEAKRQIIHATAWRVTDRSTPILDGRRVTLLERQTRLDLGTYVSGKDSDHQTGHLREFNYKDLKNTVVVIHGGGQMTSETYEKVMEEARKRTITPHALDQQQVMRIYQDLVKSGMTHLDAPMLAQPKLARAIMQEALVDYANQAIIGSDMGSDYHAANLIRQAIDTDKLSALIDKNGNSVELAPAREHALQYAPSIADLTLHALDAKFAVPANSNYGQLILASMPGVSVEKAAVIGEAFPTLGDIRRAAEAGEASKVLPRALHHDLQRPANWKDAVQRADSIVDYTHGASMEGITATDASYPATMVASGRTPIIYAMGDVDLNVPTMAMVVGGNSKPADADIDAIKNLAKEAHDKGWAVSLHMSGDASIAAAKTIAEMPEADRPRILLVGNGHPTAHSNVKVIDAVIAVAQAGGGYATVTAPLPRDNATPEQVKDDTFTYASDRRAALDFHARQSAAVVVVKSTGVDMELLGLRTAIEEGKPIAALGPVQGADPAIADLRFRGNGYSANRRLLEGGDSLTVMVETRYVAFQPTSIPDMTAQTEDRYVPFEGSTAGKQDDPTRRDNDDVDRSAIESGSRMSTTINWGDAARNIGDGSTAGSFLAEVEQNQVPSIAATPLQIAYRDLANDAKFLDVASRSDVGREVREVFEEYNERGRADIDADVQDHFLRQRAGVGR